MLTIYTDTVTFNILSYVLIDRILVPVTLPDNQSVYGSPGYSEWMSPTKNAILWRKHLQLLLAFAEKRLLRVF